MGGGPSGVSGAAMHQFGQRDCTAFHELLSSETAIGCASAETGNLFTCTAAPASEPGSKPLCRQMLPCLPARRCGSRCSCLSRSASPSRARRLVERLELGAIRKPACKNACLEAWSPSLHSGLKLLLASGPFACSCRGGLRGLPLPDPQQPEFFWPFTGYCKIW